MSSSSSRSPSWHNLLVGGLVAGLGGGFLAWRYMQGSKAEVVDLIASAKYIVTASNSLPSVLIDHALVIANGRIKAIMPRAAALQTYRAKHTMHREVAHFPRLAD